MQLNDRPIYHDLKIAMKFQPVLAVLFEGAEYSDYACCNRWEFAVGISELRSYGVTDNDLRFLVRLEFLEHGREVTAAENERRQFEPSGPYFTKRSCFVLTAKGIEAVVAAVEAGGNGHSNRVSTVRVSNGSERGRRLDVPSWDVDRRILTFQGRIVKQFKWRAGNQELVLSTFEEEDWRWRIDDPLTPSPSLDGKRRLSDTIKCLNRNQRHRLIHFRGDGTGEGITWESVGPRDFDER